MTIPFAITLGYLAFTFIVGIASVL